MSASSQNPNQLEASTQPSESPEEPSMEGVERELEQSLGQSREIPDLSENDLSEYEESYIQLGDYEVEDLPPELLKETYGDADIDGIVHHGDLTKTIFEPEEYAKHTFESYLNLNETAEALDTNAYTGSGNNDPELSDLLSGKDKDGFEMGGRPNEEQIEALEEYLQEEFAENEEWAYDEEKDPHTNLVENLDNLIDARYSEVGDELDLIFMGNHFNPELDERAYKAIFEGPGVDEFYDEEDLGEVASYLEDERSTSYGRLENIPLLGRIFKYIGSENVDPESLGLGDIPGEFKVEGHEKYDEAVGELEEEYKEDIKAFEDALDSLSARIEDADNPAIINHSVPFGKENPHGSMVLREAVKEYGEDLQFVSGGHEHSPGIEQLNGVDVINSAQRVTEIGVNADSVDYNVNSNFAMERNNGEERPSIEGMSQERLEETRSELNQGIEEIENRLANPELDEDEAEQLDQIKSQIEQELEKVNQKL